MEISYLTNGAGDLLTPVKNNGAFALFQVVNRETLKRRDIFFIVPVESKTDVYGTKLHMAGDGKWEDAGFYLKGEKAALSKLNEISGTPQPDQYYESKME